MKALGRSDLSKIRKSPDRKKAEIDSAKHAEIITMKLHFRSLSSLERDWFVRPKISAFAEIQNLI